MKKLFFTLGLASLFMVACNNAPKQEATEAPAPEQTEAGEEKHECPMGQLKDEYARWEEMDDAMKAELNQKAASVFAEMDAKMEEMKAEGKGCAEECAKKLAEMTEEQKAEFEAKKAECEAKCAEMKAKWENFANMTVDEQKDLIMERLSCGGEKKCCKGEGEKGCCHGEQKPAE